MRSYNFSLACHDDIPEILDLYHSQIGTPGCAWNVYYPNNETAKSDIENESLYILKDDDKIIAVATAGRESELDNLQWALKNPCELSRLAVIPTMKQQGIGTIILQNVIDSVKARGFDGIRMAVSKSNAAALALYDKNGFAKCGETSMYDIDFYCYQMEFSRLNEGQQPPS
ncbi:MAG: GNAT family N-acetyltransferase [Defluviitaleaceae bacterium]|nr:GNAT family N-acetyltransferase [Defluviitaleaceae bacterium]